MFTAKCCVNTVKQLKLIQRPGLELPYTPSTCLSKIPHTSLLAISHCKLLAYVKNIISGIWCPHPDRSLKISPLKSFTELAHINNSKKQHFQRCWLKIILIKIYFLGSICFHHYGLMGSQHSKDINPMNLYSCWQKYHIKTNCSRKCGHIMTVKPRLTVKFSRTLKHNKLSNFSKNPDCCLRVC